MIKKQMTLILIVMLMAVVGCTANEASNSSKKDEATALIQQAEASRKKAKSVGGEWRDIGKFIKKAKKAVKAEKYDKAIKLAKKADSQGKMGYQQMVDQQDFKMPGYFKF